MELHSSLVKEECEDDDPNYEDDKVAESPAMKLPPPLCLHSLCHRTIRLSSMDELWTNSLHPCTRASHHPFVVLIHRLNTRLYSSSISHCLSSYA